MDGDEANTRSGKLSRADEHSSQVAIDGRMNGFEDLDGEGAKRRHAAEVVEKEDVGDEEVGSEEAGLFVVTQKFQFFFVVGGGFSVTEVLKQSWISSTPRGLD